MNGSIEIPKVVRFGERLLKLTIIRSDSVGLDLARKCYIAGPTTLSAVGLFKFYNTLYDNERPQSKINNQNRISEGSPYNTKDVNKNRLINVATKSGSRSAGQHQGCQRNLFLELACLTAFVMWMVRK